MMNRAVQMADEEGRLGLRKEPRMPMDSPVALVFGKKLTSVVHARMENRSKSGALLIVDPQAELPRRFIIVDRAAYSFDLAKYVWRKGDRCGVVLIRNYDLADLRKRPGDAPVSIAG